MANTPYLFIVFTLLPSFFFFFFFNDTATTEIYTLSLHDALPICICPVCQTREGVTARRARNCRRPDGSYERVGQRSEEHTSELQSRLHLVCRLLLEKKKKTPIHLHECTLETHRHAQTASQLYSRV